MCPNEFVLFQFDIFYSRSRWRSFTNGNGMDSSSSRLYTGNRTYNLFIIFYRNYFIYFYFISVSTYQKYKCVETTECKLYMHVDDTKITSGIIQCLWHEEYRIQYNLEGIKTSRYWTYETSWYSVLEISVLNNKNNLIEFKNFFKFFLHVDVVYFGTE